MTHHVHTGPAGEAHECPPPDIPQAAQTVCRWLLNAPPYHPLWSQYQLVVVRLDSGVPGFPEPHLKFEGASHELIVVALDPEHPVTPDDLAQRDYRLRFLNPVNIAHQFTATDDEMRELAYLAARAVVDGVLNPETADAPDRIRHAWLTSLVKTLAHIRGEEHAP